jgi:hypothetical protein
MEETTEKQDKKVKRKKRMQSINQTVIFIFVLVILAMVILSPSKWSGVVVETFSNMVAFDTDLTDSLLVNCSNQSSNTLKVECVNDVFHGNFNYISVPTFPIDKVLEDGGNCMSATRWYLYAFKKVGITAQPILIYPREETAFDFFSNETGHAFVLINFDDGNATQRCFVEQGDVWCVATT